MKKILTRLILTLLIAEAAYLSLVNLALNLPLTQSLLNQHRPDKYAVHWERAWSWYPLQVQATGVSANGQTASQLWQADASVASASLALWPLLKRTVQLSAADVQDARFRLRPRPKPGKDYRKIRELFPEIEGRDPNLLAAARQPKKSGKSWRIIVDGIHIRGSHDIWVYQVRGALDGKVHGTVDFQTKGGPVSVSAGEADIALSALTVNRDWEVSSGGSLKGRFELAPLVASENPGGKALRFLKLEADIDAPVDSLAFLDFYLREFNQIKIDGKGLLSGHLNYVHGDLKPGTDLAISAEELALIASPYEARGTGEVKIAVSPKEPDTLSIGVLFGDLHALHQEDQVPLFTGSGLDVRAQGDSRVLPDEERVTGKGRLAVTIPSVRVPDLRVYQRYLPAKWDLELMGGSGSLEGYSETDAAAMRSELTLTSDNADLRFKDFRFGTNLDLGLKVGAGAAETASVDLSGTYLRLDGARLTSEGRGTSKPWQASLSIAEGTLGVPMPEVDGEMSGFRHLSEVFKERGFKDLLTSADAALKADLRVSDLGWVNLLFKNPFDLAVSGAGNIAADLKIHEGWIAKGTVLRAHPEGLRVQVLDYVVQGRGEVAVTVEQGGERPDMRLHVQLAGARLKRHGEEDAVVEEVTLAVSALATDVTLDGGGSVAAVDLRIPSARVSDMSVYNQYLPKDAPINLLGGTADLTADVRLEPKSAGGFVKLTTQGLTSRLDEQQIAGELTLDIKLKDGVPSDMDFDISGSSLRLDRFKVSGGEKSFDQPDWDARFDLNKAHVVWRKPVRLEVEAGVEMKDSRPIVAMFANQKGKTGWLDKLLTVEGIEGKAELKIAGERALVPFALVGSDKIDVGAKGLVDASTREGIFFARFRKLHGILKVKNGEKNFDILGARKKFDAYVPGETPLQLSGSQPESTEEPAESDQEKTDRRAGEDKGTRDPTRDSGRGSYDSLMTD